LEISAGGSQISERGKIVEKMSIPKQIFARIREHDGDDETYVEANETPDEFDEEGIVGRYELVEEGKITIENSFIPKKARET
jgi:hypothetical protein